MKEITCEIGTCFLLVRILKTKIPAAPALTALTTTTGTAGAMRNENLQVKL